VPDEPVTGAGDAVKLERIAANLLSNAAKFSAAPSPIEMTLRDNADEGWVELAVTDYGVGIPEDQLERIFERFLQLDGGTTREVGGFGIGLSLTRNLVQAHGGTISVQSVVGSGSTFTVRIPKTPPPTPAPARDFDSSEPASTRR
jgi:two-component system, OmpR family, sensor kinase